VALMSSYTARTSGLACSYSMNPRVDMLILNSLLQVRRKHHINALGDMKPDLET
jgi:hypothetical protein